MAPRTSKRPTDAAASAASADRPTKRRTHDVVALQCNSVAAALRHAPGLTAEVQGMLAGLVPTSLGVYKGDRHVLQQRAVEMIEEALGGMEARLKSNVDEAKIPVDRAAQDKEERAAAQQAAEDSLTELATKVAEARSAVDASTKAIKSATAAVAAATAVQEEGDALWKQTHGKKVRLEEVYQQTFNRIMEIGLAQRSDIKLLTKTGKDFDFDASLIASMGAALEKGPSARGPFDTVILDKLKAEFSAAIDRQDKHLQEEEPGRFKRSEAVAHAQAEMAAATDAHERVKTLLAAAIAQEKGGRARLKAASSAVASYMADTKEKMDAYDEAQRCFQEFVHGPLAAFSALKQLTPHTEDAKNNEAAVPKNEALPQPTVSDAAVAGA